MSGCRLMPGAIAAALLLLGSGYAHSEATVAASIDLATDEGVNLVHGQWRYSDARLVEAASRRLMAGQPTGAAVTT